MKQKIIIWDNDGTIMGSKDPNDSQGEKILLPNIEHTMNQKDVVNIICSGCATPESELQNFDSQKVTERFRTLMQKLPISFAVFSPSIGGTECYVVDQEQAIKAHENPKYKSLIGQFKKPGVGMLVVIQDIIQAKYKDYDIVLRLGL